MNVTDVSSVATQVMMAQQNSIQEKVGTAALKKTMDAQEQEAAAIVQMMDQARPDGKGGNISVYA